MKYRQRGSSSSTHHGGIQKRSSKPANNPRRANASRASKPTRPSQRSSRTEGQSSPGPSRPASPARESDAGSSESEDPLAREHHTVPSPILGGATLGPSSPDPTLEIPATPEGSVEPMSSWGITPAREKVCDADAQLTYTEFQGGEVIRRHRGIRILNGNELGDAQRRNEGLTQEAILRQIGELVSCFVNANSPPLLYGELVHLEDKS